MMHRKHNIMEALGAVHRAKRRPPANQNLVYSIMGEIRTLGTETAWDFVRIAFPFSAAAGLAAALLFMIGTGTKTGIEDLMLAMVNGGASTTGMLGLGL